MKKTTLIRILSVLAVLALAIGLCGCDAKEKKEPVPEKKAEEKKSDAQALLDAGDYAGAAEAFDELDREYQEALKLKAYYDAIAKGEAGDYKACIDELSNMEGFMDSDEMVKYYTARQSEAAGKKADQKSASDAVSEMQKQYSDAADLKKYSEAVSLGMAGDYEACIREFEELGDFKDSRDMIRYYEACLLEAAGDDENRAKAAAVFEEMRGFMDCSARADSFRDLQDGSAYQAALDLIGNGSFEEAAAAFEPLGDYRDSKKLISYCAARLAGEDDDRVLEAAALYDAAGGVLDSAERAENCRQPIYQQAMELKISGAYEEAGALFGSLGEYSDSKARVTECEKHIKYDAAMALKLAGDYEAASKAFKALEPFRDSTSGKDSAAQRKECDKQIKYNKAVENRETGNYKDAIKFFEDNPNFSDCALQLLETRYQMAGSNYAQGNYLEAWETYLQIPDYKDVNDILSKDYNIVLTAAQTPYRQVGGTVRLGSMNAGSDADDLEWLILAYDKMTNRALYISRYVLDSVKYNEERADVTWETCTLRARLNDSFLHDVFSEEQQNWIVLTDVDNNNAKQGLKECKTDGGNATQDKIFLLSWAEASGYFKNEERSCAPTAYAVEQGVREVNGACGWWLRSPGYVQDAAMCVVSTGVRESGYVDETVYGLRPAMWIDLNLLVPEGWTEPAGDTAEVPAEDIAEDIAEDTAEDIAEDIAEDTVEDTAEDTAEDIAEDTAEDTVEDTAEDTAEDTVEDTAENTAEDTVEPAGQEETVPVTGEAAEPVTVEDGTAEGSIFGDILEEMTGQIPPQE